MNDIGPKLVGMWMGLRPHPGAAAAADRIPGLRWVRIAGDCRHSVRLQTRRPRRQSTSRRTTRSNALTPQPNQLTSRACVQAERVGLGCPHSTQHTLRWNGCQSGARCGAGGAAARRVGGADRTCDGQSAQPWTPVAPQMGTNGLLEPGARWQQCPRSRPAEFARLWEYVGG